MPEQISKYPDVTLQVLKGAGAQCAEGAEQRILRRCPPERFCSLTTGEICVYGIEDIPRMTQITRQELARVVCPGEQQAGAGFSPPSPFDMGILGVTFAVGLVIGNFWRKLKKS